MKILSVDTSTMNTCVSILDENKIIADYVLNQEMTHSESLVPMIDNLLKGLGIKITDIDLVAVGIGPGSFTGLRIGITTVRTICQVTGIKLVGVSTLEALAYNIKGNSYILPLLDAKGGRNYAGIYKRDNELHALVKDELYEEDGLLKIIDGYSDIIAIGDYSEDTKELLKGKVSFADPSLNGVISRNIAYIAKDLFLKGYSKEYTDVLPNYIRKSQAQRDLEGKCNDKL